jgi:hypothetical protein
MDIMVARHANDTVWNLRDLLGRSMGSITQEDDGFVIAPAGETLKAMSTVNLGPYSTLDAALVQIEVRTRSVCRREN